MSGPLTGRVALVAGATRGAGRGTAVALGRRVRRSVAPVARLRLEVLVNDIWGGEKLVQWNTPVWEHDLENGLRLLRLAIDTHLITSHFALALMIRRPGGLVVEMTDGTLEYNAQHYRLSTFYALAKTAVSRLAFAQSKELAPHGCSAVALTRAGCARR